MSIARILQVLLARWKAALLVFIVAAAAGVGYAWTRPVGYTATATVVIDARPDPVAGISQIAAPNFLLTQVDIVQSARVANRVIRSLKLNENPGLKEQYEESASDTTFDDWLSRLLQRSLSVEPGRGSNVLHISYTSREPRFSAVMANAFVRAYLDVVLEMRVEPARRYTEFFDDRTKQRREILETAQARLSAFQKEKGIITTDERIDIETAKLTELSSQLLAMQALTSESSSRQRQGAAAGDQSPDVMSNSMVNNLKSELTQKETRLSELTSRLGESHPQVVETRISIAELRAKIDSEIRRVKGSVGVADAINRQREAETRAALAAQRAKLLQLKEWRDELAVLQRDVENAQRAYDQVQQRYTQSDLESQNQQTAISVLNQAETPTESANAKFLKLAVQAVILAFGLGCAAALGLELIDKRVRVPSDILNAVELPVIGLLPGPDRRGFRGRLKPSVLHRRLLRQLPGPTR